VPDDLDPKESKVTGAMVIPLLIICGLLVLLIVGVVILG